MKTNEILNQITSLELDIANLDHSDFRELHGLSEEDVKNIKEELTKQVVISQQITRKSQLSSRATNPIKPKSES